MKWLRFPRILGIVVCLYLIGMSMIFGVLSSQNYRFVHGASKTTGTIVAMVPRAPVGSARGPNSRTASTAPTVRYVVNGTSYDYTAAHGRFRQRLKVGDSVTVLYDPAKPSVARIRGEGKILIPVITSSFVLSAVLVAVILFKTRKLGAAPVRRKSEGHPERTPQAPVA